jgi:hypothetical protein
MRLNILIILIITFQACQQSEIIDQQDQQEYEFEVKLVDEIKFLLDSISSGIPSEINEAFRSNSPNDTLFEVDRTYFQFSSNGNLLYYDANNYQLIHKINMQGEFLNNLGMVFGAYTLNSDSIYLFATPYIGLIDAAGNLKDKFNYMNYAMIAEPTPISNFPFHFTGSKIIAGFLNKDLPPSNFNTKLESSEVGNRILTIDLIKKESSFSFPFSNEYLENRYYSRYYYHPTITETKDVNKFLVSLAGDNNIYLTDFKSFTEPIYAGISDFSVKTMNNPMQNGYNHYRMNYAYHRVIYDKYKGYTYRFLTIPKNDSQLESPDMVVSRFKELIIIVLDDKLEKIAETRISVDFMDIAVFVTEKGLHIWNHKKTNIDEDNMYFGVFNVVKKDSQ